MLCRVANDNDPGRFCALHQMNGSIVHASRLRLNYWLSSFLSEVVPLPRNCCTIYPIFAYLAMFCLCCVQSSTYRHVGLGLQLPQSADEKARLVHTKIHTNWCRTLWSDWGKLCGRAILIPLHFLFLLLTCTNPVGYRDNHGYVRHGWAFFDISGVRNLSNRVCYPIPRYPEYWVRVNQQLPYLKSLKDEEGNHLSLEELYREFLNDDRTIVKTRFM